MEIKQICKFKAHYNICWYGFCLGSVSKDLTKDKLSEISLYDTIYHFSADHNSVGKEDIFNIYEYLMVKNSIK